jgi:uncharacterized protein YciI
MFIVSLTYTAPLEEVDQHLDEHVSYLKRQYAAGGFVASGRKIPRTGGIILSKLENRATLDAVLEQDPFHRAGVADYETIEFDPSMVAEGFEILQ